MNKTLSTTPYNNTELLLSLITIIKFVLIVNLENRINFKKQKAA